MQNATRLAVIKRRVLKAVQEGRLKPNQVREEIQRRLADDPTPPQARLPPVIRVPLPPRAALRAAPRPAAATTRSARRPNIRTVSAPEMVMANRLAPHVPETVPPGALPATSIARVMSTVGQGTKTVSLSPTGGDKSIFAVIADPNSPHFGWFMLLDDLSGHPVGASSTPYGTFYQNVKGLSNGVLPVAPTTAGGCPWQYLPYVRDPFTGTDNSAPESYITYDTINNEVSCSPVKYKSGVTVVKGHMEMTVNCSYLSQARVYSVGSSTHPFVMGPQTGVRVTNDGNPNDSIVVCNNPLVALQDDADHTLLQGVDLSKTVPEFVTPEVQMGGGNSACRHYTMDCWLPNFGRYARSAGTTFNDTASINAYGQSAITSAEAAMSGTVPFVYRGSDRDDTKYSQSFATSAQATEAYFTQYGNRMGYTGNEVSQGADGLFYVEVSGGPVTITLNYSRTYGIYVEPSNILGRAGVAPMKLPIAEHQTAFGQVGHALTLEAARKMRIDNTAAKAAAEGKPIPKAILDGAMQVAKSNTVPNLISGVINTVADVGNKILDTAQRIPVQALGSVAKSVFGNTFGGALEGVASKALSWLPDIAEIF
jgi:hypothetical protein